MQSSALLLALALVGSLASPSLAQRPGPQPQAQRQAQRQAMRAVPVTAPPTAHPALVGQPLIGADGGPTTSGRTASGGPAAPAGCASAPMPAIDPDTRGVKVSGKELVASVKKLTQLPWFEDLADARVESAATGRPIFWVQALGDIDGFA